MSANFYADGVTNIALLQGMIRIDFATLSLSEKDEDGNPEVEAAHRIIMSPQGFVKAFGTMEQVMDKLVETGIIRDPDDDERRSGPARDTDAAVTAAERRAHDRRKRPL